MIGTLVGSDFMFVVGVGVHCGWLVDGLLACTLIEAREID